MPRKVRHLGGVARFAFEFSPGGRLRTGGFGLGGLDAVMSRIPRSRSRAEVLFQIH